MDSWENFTDPCWLTFLTHFRAQNTQFRKAVEKATYRVN